MSEVRKEIKYVVPIADFLRMKPQLLQIMKADVNGEDGHYTVRSLYFDSIYDHDLNDNISGMMEKRKVRLRTYDPKLGRVRLEWKCKEGSDGRKFSFWISKEEAMAMIEGDFSFLEERKGSLEQTLYKRLLQGCYLPKTIIEYQREAYSYPVSDTRITFDQSVRAVQGGLNFFEDELCGLPLIDESVGIFEIKYNDFVPYPIRQITSGIDRCAVANSKYTQARLALI